MQPCVAGKAELMSLGALSADFRLLLMKAALITSIISLVSASNYGLRLFPG